MSAIEPSSPPRPARRGTDRGLVALIAGALVLIAIGLVSMALFARATPVLAPADTPEGTAQRFYAAAYQGDYAASHRLLSAGLQRELSEFELQQRMSAELKQTQIRVGVAAIHGDSATVLVTMTHYSQDGLFGAEEWTSTHELGLQREGGAWTIAGGPFWVKEVSAP